MDNIKNDKYYIQKIIQDLQFIVKHMYNVDAALKGKKIRTKIVYK